IQWFFDPAVLIRERKFVIIGTLIPSIYFGLADSFAIGSGIWEISSTLTTGVKIFNLPLEELLFFVVTSLLLAQGLVLWHSLRPPRPTA
ncbi:MAG: lycopene cyclase domain-containing protein, partial [Akkermansiaceae bacterium]